MNKLYWEWCAQCKQPYVKCPDCNGTHCNGGGCEKCTQMRRRVLELIESDEAPGQYAIEIQHPSFDG